ncbi:hypothetical protein BD413DRAFT_164767 [Trametes elegans]|nr:hypothetical protein BD413DRAFT_164767 [Trametes elegans]
MEMRQELTSIEDRVLECGEEQLPVLRPQLATDSAAHGRGWAVGEGSRSAHKLRGRGMGGLRRAPEEGASPWQVPVVWTMEERRWENSEREQTREAVRFTVSMTLREGRPRAGGTDQRKRSVPVPGCTVTIDASKWMTPLTRLSRRELCDRMRTVLGTRSGRKQTAYCTRTANGVLWTGDECSPIARRKGAQGAITRRTRQQTGVMRAASE